MRRCCIQGCDSLESMNEDELLLLSYYSFPQNQLLKRKWIKNINVLNMQTIDIQQSRCLTVCSLHFVPTVFIETGVRQILKSSAVPTIFPYMPEYIDIPENDECETKHYISAYMSLSANSDHDYETNKPIALEFVSLESPTIDKNETKPNILEFVSLDAPLSDDETKPNKFELDSLMTISCKQQMEPEPVYNYTADTTVNRNYRYTRVVNNVTKSIPMKAPRDIEKSPRHCGNSRYIGVLTNCKLVNTSEPIKQVENGVPQSHLTHAPSNNQKKPEQINTTSALQYGNNSSPHARCLRYVGDVDSITDLSPKEAAKIFPKLKSKILNYRKVIKQYQTNIRRQRKKINSLKSTIKELQPTCVPRAMRCMCQSSNNKIVKMFQKGRILGQIQPDLKQFALKLYAYSSVAYEYVREISDGQLPSKRTVRKWNECRSAAVIPSAIDITSENI